MAPKISLLHVTADSSLLECERATQEFIAATDAVFFKAQGLAMLVPLHEMVFGLLEGLLDNWRLLNLDSVEWPCKAEVHQACINLWSLNKQAPWSTEFGKTVVSWKHAISTIEQIKLMHFEKMVIELELTVPIVVPKTVVNLAPTPVSATSSIQHVPFHSLYTQSFQSTNASSFRVVASRAEGSSCHLAPHNKGKGKAKAMEDDKDKEEATQKFRKELKDFVVSTKRCYHKSKGCLWNGVGVRMQKKRPPLAALIVAKHVKLVQAAKAFLKWQGKSSQFFVLEGYKEKGKAKALLKDSEQVGTKQSFKSMELADSDSNKEEEDRVCIIKKVKRKHVEELTGARKRKEIIELDKEVEIVVPKTPVAGPSHQTSKPIVLVSSAPKPIPKLIIVLASPVAGPSTAPIVPSSAPKPAAATALFKPAPVKSARPAVKGGSIFKDPFMVRQFKLVGTEESRVLIINQATEVPVTQGTLQSGESSNEDSNNNEDGQGDDDNSNNDNAAMDIDSTKHPEETQPVALTKTMITKVKTLVLVPVPVADKTEEDPLLQVVLY
ncbi:hypothetical protein C0995_009253 [Termitomyces sp. Mi166|nr:hypothetical protein C0995_009253 [Termitomyces sp. Mi166\